MWRRHIGHNISSYRSAGEFLAFLFSFQRFPSRNKELPREAAARIRKFVYYKLRKSELMEIDSGEFERSRGRGHVGVAAEVERELAAV